MFNKILVYKSSNSPRVKVLCPVSHMPQPMQLGDHIEQYQFAHVTLLGKPGIGKEENVCSLQEPLCHMVWEEDITRVLVDDFVDCAQKGSNNMMVSKKFLRIRGSGWRVLEAKLEVLKHLGHILELLMSILIPQSIRFRSRSCPKAYF